MKHLKFPPNHDLSSLLLRLSIGSVFFLHGIGKPLTIGMLEIIEVFYQKGFPAWIAYSTIAVEIIGGIMLLLGYYSRLACVILIPINLGILMYHIPYGWMFHNRGGGWEYPNIILFVLISIFFLGTGKFGIKKD